MKRIITIIFSIMLVMTAFAQKDFGLDEIAKSINSYNWKEKVHQKGTYVIFEHKILLGRSFRNMKGITDLVNSRLAEGKETLDAETLKAKIDNDEKVYKETCARVRHILDSLMQTSEESYHFENHNHNSDTINYSICLKSNKSRKQSEEDWEFPDTTETITFSLHSKEIEIGKKIYFEILHKRIEYADCSKEKYFDLKAYKNAILPVLNHKDIKTWDFTWQVDKDHSDKNKESWNYNYKNMNGIRKGTMFFIPFKDELLADSIMEKVSKATEDYLAKNGNQLYHYRYNDKDEIIYCQKNKRYKTFAHVLGATIMDSNGMAYFNLNFSTTEDGYYITLSEEKGNIPGRPKEWTILKSYNNGKKEYIKGYSKKKK